MTRLDTSGCLKARHPLGLLIGRTTGKGSDSVKIPYCKSVIAVGRVEIHCTKNRRGEGLSDRIVAIVLEYKVHTAGNPTSM